MVWTVRLLIALVALVACPIAVDTRAAAQGTPRLVSIRDAETEAMLRSFVRPLFTAAGLNPGLIRITVLQDRAINAFVTTGNRMVIHTGLIQQVQAAEELMGVLAHETGHISGGHLARLPEEMRMAMITSVIAMLAGGAAAALSGRGDAAAAVALGGQSMAMRNLFTFTRGQERAADQAGMTYLERNGWSARGLRAMFERLRAQDLLVTDRQDPYMLTHPLTTDRIEAVEDFIRRSRHADARLPPDLTEDFLMVRAKLDGFLDPGSVRRRYPESDRSRPARYARAIALYRTGHTLVAAEALAGLIAEDRANPYLHEMQCQVLFEGGRVRDAVAPCREAARLAPAAALIRLAYGRVLMESGGMPGAIAELEASTRLEPESAFGWEQLGIAHGRSGQAARADLALAEAALIRQEWRDARIRAERAAQALPAGPGRLRAQDIVNAARRENRPPNAR